MQPPGGQDARNHGIPIQDDIGILVAKKRKAGDMFDQAATLLTMKVQQWHPAKQLRDRSKLAIPLKKELDMTPVPVEHHLGTAGERESTCVRKHNYSGIPPGHGGRI